MLRTKNLLDRKVKMPIGTYKIVGIRRPSNIATLVSKETFANKCYKCHKKYKNRGLTYAYPEPACSQQTSCTASPARTQFSLCFRRVEDPGCVSRIRIFPSQKPGQKGTESRIRNKEFKGIVKWHRMGGCERYQSIDLLSFYNSANLKILFKGPWPFKQQNIYNSIYKDIQL
jgi:hypothetical protein